MLAFPLPPERRYGYVGGVGYFDSEDNVDQYLAMAQGYDGAELVAELRNHLPRGARVLELGMGGGTDLDLLQRAGFEATGSDTSEVFLRRYKDRGGECKTLQLDACTIETHLRFDAIYSNKVLHHLTRAEMVTSLVRQAEVIADDGLLFHSLWLGKGHDEHHGLLFTYYDRASLASVIPASLELSGFELYAEMKPNDSCRVILRPQGRVP